MSINGIQNTEYKIQNTELRMLCTRREQGSFANVDQERQAWSDCAGGETGGRSDSVSALGRLAGVIGEQVKSCSDLSTLLEASNCS